MVRGYRWQWLVVCMFCMGFSRWVRIAGYWFAVGIVVGWGGFWVCDLVGGLRICGFGFGVTLWV